MLIRLQCIYNLWSIHAIILSFLDILQSFYSNFISFLGLTYWHSAQWQLMFFACFLHRRKSISNGVQRPQNFVWIFYGPEHPGWAKEAHGWCPKGGTTNQGAPGGPGVPWWVVPPLGHPQVLLWPTGGLLVNKKSTKSFAAFGLRLVLIFCKVKNKQKQQLALGIMSIG